MWDLPMYMGLVGSVAYVAYKLLYRMNFVILHITIDKN